MKDHTFPQVTRLNLQPLEGGAAGTRTQDRRIMSPDGQRLSSGWLTWADMHARDHAPGDLGTYWA